MKKIEEVTVAGDVGSGSGTEPMVRYGDIKRRNKPLKKQKLKTFKKYVELESFKKNI